MQGLQFQNLTVESVEVKDGRVVIKAGGKSYSFFQNKQSGEVSRAQADYLRLAVIAGQTYSFGISESQGVNSQTGSPVTYRNIGVIGEATPSITTGIHPPLTKASVQHPQPYVPTPPAPTTTNIPPQDQPQSNRLQAIEDRLTSLENRVSLLDSEAEIDTAKIPPLEKGNEELEHIGNEANTPF